LVALRRLERQAQTDSKRGLSPKDCQTAGKSRLPLSYMWKKMAHQYVPRVRYTYCIPNAEPWASGALRRNVDSFTPCHLDDLQSSVLNPIRKPRFFGQLTHCRLRTHFGLLDSPELLARTLRPDCREAKRSRHTRGATLVVASFAGRQNNTCPGEHETTAESLDTYTYVKKPIIYHESR
jgi:hypothetical protein